MRAPLLFFFSSLVLERGRRRRRRKSSLFLSRIHSLFFFKKTKKNENENNQPFSLRRPLDVGPYLKHLSSKYGPLYELPEGRAEELIAPGLKLASEALERARKR